MKYFFKYIHVHNFEIKKIDSFLDPWILNFHISGFSCNFVGWNRSAAAGALTNFLSSTHAVAPIVVVLSLIKDYFYLSLSSLVLL